MTNSDWFWQILTDSDWFWPRVWLILTNFDWLWLILNKTDVFWPILSDFDPCLGCFWPVQGYDWIMSGPYIVHVCLSQVWTISAPCLGKNFRTKIDSTKKYILEVLLWIHIKPKCGHFFSNFRPLLQTVLNWYHENQSVPRPKIAGRGIICYW